MDGSKGVGMFMKVWFLLMLVGFLALWFSSGEEKINRNHVLFVIVASLWGTLVSMFSVWEG